MIVHLLLLSLVDNFDGLNSNMKNIEQETQLQLLRFTEYYLI